MTKIVQIVHKYPGCCSVLLGKIRLIAGNYQDKQRKNDKYRIARRHTRIDKLLNTILPDVQRKRLYPRKVQIGYIKSTMIQLYQIVTLLA